MFQSHPIESPSQTFLRNLVNSMLDPVLVKDRHHQWVFFNEAFCQLVGHSREELIHKTDRDFFSPEEADRHHSQNELVLSTGIPDRHTGMLIGANGTPVAITTHKSVFQDEAGCPFLLNLIRPVPTPELPFLLQAVIDCLPQQLFWKDQHSVYLGCNQAFAQAIGVNSPQDIIGKSDADLPPLEEAWYQRDCSDLAANLPCTTMSQLQADGSQRWLEASFVPLHNAAGQIIGMVGVGQDVTTLQQSIESLRQNAATSRALVEAIPDLLIRMRADGTYLNLAFEGSFKPFAINASTGRTIQDTMPPHIVKERLRHIDRALQTGQLQIYDQELTIDGNLIYEEVRLVPSGKDEVLTMIRDVTDRRQAELALQQLNEALEQKIEERTLALRQAITLLEQEISERKSAKAQLQEKEQFLRGIYEGIEHQIFVIDVPEDGNLCYAGWNPFTEKMTQISSEEAIGLTPEIVFGEIDGKAVRRRYQSCLTVGTTVSYEECVPFHGENRWFITTLNPLKDEVGRIYRMVGTTFDITDRKQAETALQESETQLRQQTQALEQTLHELQHTQMQLVQSEKMSSLGQLVAGVAHEINNPVNFIYGNLKHAGDYTQDLIGLLHLYQKHHPEPITEIQKETEAIDLDFLMEDLPRLLASMKVGADRIQKIVASLRTFSRMDEAEMKAVNIHECIDSTLMILQNRLKAKPERPKIEVVKYYESLPLIECYAGQLNQVFMNILSNAIDALEDALLINADLIPTISIQVGMVDAEHVMIQIVDNGAGIPEQAKAKIFDPFFTTKPIGKGTGMGLSISYQIVTEKHNGRLECRSTPGEGTEFAIEIPICQVG